MRVPHTALHDTIVNRRPVSAIIERDREGERRREREREREWVEERERESEKKRGGERGIGQM